jgi:hypothetical protein
MKTIKAWPGRAGLAVALCIGLVLAIGLPARADSIGEERSVYERLENGEEISLHLDEVLRRGRLAFEAQWTPAEGGGRPMTTGTGGALANGASPLHFPRNFNRVSAQDSNGCAHPGRRRRLCHRRVRRGTALRFRDLRSQ